MLRIARIPPGRWFAVLAAVIALAAYPRDAAADDLLGVPRAPSPADVVISNAVEFSDALEKAAVGGVISLRPGNYENLSIRGFRPDDRVVIRSADPERPARIGALDVVESERLWFERLRFAAPKAPAGPGTYIARVQRSRDIGFAGNEIRGLVDDDYTNDPSGVTIQQSERIVFAGNRLHHLARGFVAGGVRQAEISANRFSDLRIDGADFAGVQDVLIEGNVFTTFHPASEDHADFIQFWQRNALIEDTRRVVIRGNTFLQGNGDPTQTIFIGNKIEGQIYRDFVIEDNIIYNANPHGISLYDLEGGRIANNTVVTTPGGAYDTRINLFRTLGVDVLSNVAPLLVEQDTQDLLVARNVFTRGLELDDPRHPGSLFIDVDAGPWAHASSFAPRPGGLLDLPENERIGALAASHGIGDVHHGDDFQVPLSVVPLPPTLPLFGSALSTLAVFGWRRKRRASRALSPVNIQARRHLPK